MQPTTTKDTNSHVSPVTSDDAPLFTSIVGVQTAVPTAAIHRSIEMTESSRQNFVSSVVLFDSDIVSNQEILHLMDVKEEAFT